ncbi:hypothetical protein L291_2497 [Acinetobacter guillouiae MSP4-18]|uniref:Arc family DNA-binding protein n=1 Tax=Acinetobacter guillouiae TaxID=106649 RepID=UPI0002D1381A|nr:Arc family DNA-binding protein [Acinetobacter guillouiae]ENU56740.1 hypothetical protein F981_04247 [Acinetobacter guillouiae CIP 63.46]EPH34290.1 hypothetical protein L291_2497 [Acinetobacter guillouiae MSP4-18]KAB0623679.1 Arc family DNA-binding protein [Acinetobacter guillouiae]
MAKDYTQVNFRIPVDLKDRIDLAAAENKQSITAEIVERLESSFSNEVTISSDIMETLEQSNDRMERAVLLIEKLMQRVEELETNKPTD